MVSLIKQNKYYKKTLLCNNYCNYYSSFPDPGKKNNNKYLLFGLATLYYLINQK